MDFYNAIKNVMYGKSMRLAYWEEGTKIKLVRTNRKKRVVTMFFASGAHCDYRIEQKDVEKECWEEYKEK